MTFDIENGVLKKVHNCDAHVVIPDFVTHIGNGAFRKCSSLRSVSLPDSVTHIGNGAFYGCPSLRSVSIPDSVTHIGKCAFEYCCSLRSVSIPESVMHIGGSAFYGCLSLQTVSISLKHFECSGTKNALNNSSAIICIVPLSAIPEEYRLKACIGYALREADYPEALRGEYLDHLRTCAAKLCKAAVTLPDLLSLLCREGLIDASSFPAFLEEALRLNAVDLTALLLEYKNTRLANDAPESANTDDFSL